MLGSLDNAETAYLLHAGLVFDRYGTPLNEYVVPEGWVYLGRGISRIAYLGPDSVVYKVGDNISNSTEMRQARILDALGLPEGFGVPKMHGWNIEDKFIVAAEFMGSDEPFWEDYQHIVQGKNPNRVFRSKDFHSGNLRFKDGVLYAIDLGFGNTNFYEDVTFTEEELEKVRMMGVEV